jgi:cell filamentation protein
VSSGFANDPHSQQGYACPRNFFGIIDYARLHAVERSFAIRRAAQLEDRPVSGPFDAAHLKAIHAFLFQDVFPWAGKLRVVDMSKGNSDFGRAVFIESALSELLAKLKTERYLSRLSARDFTARCAFYLGEINAIHPFREGNGRTQREFIRQLALSAGHPLSWSGFTQQQMVDASIASHLRGDSTGLAAIIEAALYSSRENASKT